MQIELKTIEVSSGFLEHAQISFAKGFGQVAKGWRHG
jgi:hypothetical protein